LTLTAPAGTAITASTNAIIVFFMVSPFVSGTTRYSAPRHADRPRARKNIESFLLSPALT
jgi:hypothetical protein